MTKGEEQKTVEAILQMLEGKNVELSISALTKVLHPLLVGISSNRAEYIDFANKLQGHLSWMVTNGVQQNEFGFLKTGSDDPIIYKPGQ
jgi:hypothetical protein